MMIPNIGKNDIHNLVPVSGHSELFDNKPLIDEMEVRNEQLCREL
jgi:hypothetical protein